MRCCYAINNPPTFATICLRSSAGRRSFIQPPNKRASMGIDPHISMTSARARQRVQGFVTMDEQGTCNSRSLFGRPVQQLVAVAGAVKRVGVPATSRASNITYKTLMVWITPYALSQQTPRTRCRAPRSHSRPSHRDLGSVGECHLHLRRQEECCKRG